MHQITPHCLFSKRRGDCDKTCETYPAHIIGNEANPKGKRDDINRNAMATFAVLEP